ncbi:MAG: cobaltochelatase subunit CobT, partial [Pseudomonadota bacterium]
MSKPENPSEPFKKALAEATRVLADDPELGVVYSVDPPGMSSDQVRLPQVSRRMTPQEVLLARGTADAYAMRRKYHDALTHTRYAPHGQMARDLYEAMETARCEAVGAKAMPGTAGNIEAKISNEAERRGYSQIATASEAPLAVAAGYLIRELATGRALPEGASNVLDLWREHLEGAASETLGGLEACLADQASFAKFARQVIDDLGYGDQLGDDPDAMDDEENQEAEEDPDDTETDGQDNEDDQSDESDAAPEQEQESSDDPTEATVTLDEMADAEMGEETEMPEGEAPLEPPPPTPVSDADPNYQVLTTEFDEDIRAE